VIEVLPPSVGIESGRVQMGVRIHSDPDVGPSGRDPQSPDPLEILLIGDRHAICVDITKLTTASLTPQPELPTADISELIPPRHALGDSRALGEISN
jgi:hypothetical protein